jgi:GNAT superfamily N-acetyltransferase
MAKKIAIIDVNSDNVSETGFFCRMSRSQSEGNQRKYEWLKARFAEGMRMKLLPLPLRGYIEYIPGEYAWRPVRAKGYMFIHCIWVVGKSKGKGYAKILLDECIKDAQKLRMRGVAMVCSGNWLVRKEFLERRGFVSVDKAPPSFELMVKKFGNFPSPTFTNDWAGKAAKCGNCLTVLRTDQCPYLDDATRIVLDTAKELGLDCKVIELKSCRDVQRLSPSAFGVFSIVYDGKLLSYHYLLKEELIQKIRKIRRRIKN